MADPGAPILSMALHEMPLLRLETLVPALESAGLSEWYVPISDGVFAPGPHGSLEWATELAASTRLPVYLHLLVAKPDKLIDRAAAMGCRGIIVPQEACVHANRTLARIAESGKEPGVSLCAATPLSELEYLLDQATRVLLQSSEPSHSGGAFFVESAYERARILSENLRYRESRATLQVAGQLTAERAARLHKFGAKVLTLGRDALDLQATASEALASFVEELAAQRHLV